MSRKPEKQQRISLTALRKRCAEGRLSDGELRTYFEADQAKGSAFAPALKINEAHVEIRGRKPSTEEVEKLFEKATAARRLEKPGPPADTPLLKAKPPTVAARRIAVAANRVLAEGDSWFNLPDRLWPPTALDFLDDVFEVTSVAKWSDTLANMVARKQYVQKLQSGRFRHFLFSGGGNDVLDSIATYVNMRNPGDTDPANAPKYIKTSFSAQLQTSIRHYETLVADIKAVPGARVALYVHGYANAVPKPGGGSLGQPLAQKDFDPQQVGPLAAAIVAHMVKMFNDALRRFAARHAGVVYVDLRRSVTASDWHTDEIHPNRNGARKAAAAFEDAIKANIPIA